MLLFSDLHLREESADVVLGEVLPQLIFSMMNHNELTCLGDFWHLRHQVPVWLLNRVQDWLRTITTRGMKVNLLVGNHDQVDGNEDALRVFSDIPGVKVYSKPALEDGILWVPYASITEIEATLREYASIQEGRGPVLFGHFGVLGARMNSAYSSPAGVGLDLLKPFSRVFLGHYHEHQALQVSNGAQYIGSPYQIDAGEAGQTKGVSIFSRKNLSHGWFQMNWGPKFHRFEFDRVPTSKDFEAVRPKDFVHVDLTPHVDADAVTDTLNAFAWQYKLTRQVAAPVERLDVAVDAGQAPTLRDYFLGYTRLQAPQDGVVMTDLVAAFDKVLAEVRR